MKTPIAKLCSVKKLIYQLKNLRVPIDNCRLQSFMVMPDGHPSGDLSLMNHWNECFFLGFYQSANVCKAMFTEQHSSRIGETHWKNINEHL